MNKKEAYILELQTQLDELSAEIERLKARADKAEEPWAEQQVEIVQEKHRQAKEKLSELIDAGDDAWEDMKEGVSTAWHAVGDAVRSAAKRFE